jgi:hypothetical protein
MAADCTDQFSFLKNAAIADAKHDFFKGSQGNWASVPGFVNVKDGLNESQCKDIAKAPGDTKSEKETLELVGIPDIETLKDELKDSDQIKTIHGYDNIEYTISLLKSNTDEPIFDTNKLTDQRLLSLDDITAFFGSDTINLLIDASNLGIMNLISSFKRDETNDVDLTINLLLNRESINDPAGKLTSFKDTNNAKLKTDILLDNYQNVINYPRNSDELYTTPLEEDKFFSAMDFYLGPLTYRETQISPGKKRRRSIYENDEIRPTINVKIVKEYDVHTSSDPKNDNTIDSCWAQIEKLSKQPASEEKSLKMSAIFQCKRSGDWLQALSCKDKDRPYRYTSSGEVAPIRGHITLVTHDIILLAYSLFMGTDVLFTHFSDGEHTLFYFKNPSNSETPEETARRKNEEDDAKIAEAKNYIKEVDGTYLNTFKNFVEVNIEIQKKEINAKEKPNEYFKELWTYVDIYKQTFDRINFGSFLYGEDLINKYNEAEAEADMTISDAIDILDFKKSIAYCETNIKEQDAFNNIVEMIKRKMRDEDAYSQIVDPFTILNPSIGGRRRSFLSIEQTPVKRTINMINRFDDTLPDDIYIDFMNTCSKWNSEDMYNKLVTKSNKTSVINLIYILLIKTDLNERQPEKLKEEVRALYVKGAFSENDYDEIINMIDAYALRLVVNNLGPEQGSGGLARVGLGILGDLENPPDMDGGGERKIIKVKNEYNIADLKYSFLINLYLNTLYHNLNEIDSESNMDFQYYEQFISYIQHIFKTIESAKDRVGVLYNYLIVNKDIPSILTYLGRQICLEALGLWNKDFYKPAIEVDIPAYQADKTFIGEFKTRKETLLKFLHDTFETIVFEGTSSMSESSKTIKIKGSTSINATKKRSQSKHIGTPHKQWSAKAKELHLPKTNKVSRGRAGPRAGHKHLPPPIAVAPGG